MRTWYNERYWCALVWAVPPVTSHASCDQTPIASRASHDTQTTTAANNQTANKPLLQPKAWHQPGKHTSPKQNTTSPWAKVTRRLTPKVQKRPVENYNKIISIFYKILSQNSRMPNRHTEYFQLSAGNAHITCAIMTDWHITLMAWCLVGH